MTYPRAPITEAVIDIRVVPRADLSVEDFRKLADEFGGEFGTQNDQFRVMAQETKVTKRREDGKTLYAVELRRSIFLLVPKSRTTPA
jgi:hypothetical protein